MTSITDLMGTFKMAMVATRFEVDMRLGFCRKFCLITLIVLLIWLRGGKLCGDSRLLVILQIIDFRILLLANVHKQCPSLRCDKFGKHAECHQVLFEVHICR